MVIDNSGRNKEISKNDIKYVQEMVYKKGNPF